MPDCSPTLVMGLLLLQPTTGHLVGFFSMNFSTTTLSYTCPQALGRGLLPRCGAGGTVPDYGSLVSSSMMWSSMMWWNLLVTHSPVISFLLHGSV